jgi:hypothetical protein
MALLRFLARIAAVLLLAGAAGCASKGAPSQSKVSGADVKIYQTPDLLRSQYTLVEHVWIDSWRSNITYPSFGTEQEGIDAMKRAAADAGANALIHVICLDARIKSSETLKLYCYGDAIRVN